MDVLAPKLGLPRVASLPGSATQGDAVVLSSDGLLYVYDGTSWVKRTGPLTKRIDTIVTSGLSCWWRSSIGVSLSSAPAVTEVLDYSGNNNKLEQVTAGARPTLSAGALAFDGSNQFIDAADSATTDPTTAFMLALRVNPTTFASGRAAITKASTSGSGSWSTYWTPTELYFFTGAGLSNGWIFTQVVPTGAWSTVLFIYSGSTCRLRVNGAEYAIASTIGSPAASLPVGTNPVRVGAYGDGGASAKWSGSIREVVLANIVPSAQQILDLEDVLTNGPTEGGVVVGWGGNIDGGGPSSGPAVVAVDGGSP